MGRGNLTMVSEDDDYPKDANGDWDWRNDHQRNPLLVREDKKARIEASNHLIIASKAWKKIPGSFSLINFRDYAHIAKFNDIPTIHYVIKLLLEDAKQSYLNGDIGEASRRARIFARCVLHDLLVKLNSKVK